ncbi:hypothetical protein [Caballeronia calidae]|uniref:hypothetical protein n=1 Tax=Caballeronia calidae TaxID=1777139 RepID=UPI0012FE3EB2|nr:hypothetical protein [Caballeronia calidae]
MLSIEQAREMRQGVSLSGDRNQCAECGELFNSVYSFEKDRTGTIGVYQGRRSPLHGPERDADARHGQERCGLLGHGTFDRSGYQATKRSVRHEGDGRNSRC